jgi:hypothetical protein
MVAVLRPAARLVAPKKPVDAWETRDSCLNISILKCQDCDSVWQFPVIVQEGLKATTTTCFVPDFRIIGGAPIPPMSLIAWRC